MKKIIAAAIAGAFVVPAVQAADVTLGGEIELVVANGEAFNSTSNGENELQVRATEELGNGLTMAAYLDVGTSANTGMTISGPFGSFTAGNDTDTAIIAMDDKADVAEAGGAAGAAAYGNIATTLGTITNAYRLDLNTGIEGLSVSAGMGFGNAKEDEVSDFAVGYSAAGLSLSYGEAEVETSDVTVKNVSVSYTYGPFYIGVDNVDGHKSIDGGELEAVGVTYNYGPGKIFVETNERNYNSTSGALLSAGTTAKTNVVGISYQIGGLNTYVATESADSADATTEADTTYLGLEYNF